VFLIRVSFEFERSVRSEYLVEDRDGYPEAALAWVLSDEGIPAFIVEFDLEAADGPEVTLAVALRLGV